MQPKITIISGAPGVGKTTTIKELCKKVPNSVHISVDKLRKLIKSGYVSPDNWNDEVNRQYKLARKNTTDLTKNFVEAGFNVFIDDVFRNEWKEEILKTLSNYEINFIYLRADLKTIIHRDTKREHVVGEDIITKCFNNLEQQNTSENGWIVINNETSIDDIVEKILTSVN